MPQTLSFIFKRKVSSIKTCTVKFRTQPRILHNLGVPAAPCYDPGVGDSVLSVNINDIRVLAEEYRSVLVNTGVNLFMPKAEWIKGQGGAVAKVLCSCHASYRTLLETWLRSLTCESGITGGCCVRALLAIGFIPLVGLVHRFRPKSTKSYPHGMMAFSPDSPPHHQVNTPRSTLPVQYSCAAVQMRCHILAK